MKKNKLSKRGFTLVELLVTITIIGILTGFGIFNYTKIINKSKGENYETNVSSLKVVSESYLQANKELAPKNIGDTIEIKVSDLKEANYLTEDIYNADGESCMKESYVKVYKSSQTDYVYTPYIYCGKDSVPEEKTPNQPSVELNFSPSDEVANPYFTYKIKGDPSNGSVLIDGFTYTIYAKLKGESDFQEVYKSGSISGNRQATIEGKKFLRDHIDISSYSSINVSITAVNELGGIITVTRKPEEAQTYHDSVIPKCADVKNQAKDFNDWIGKNNDPPSRTITVVCDDKEKNGSGCIRTNFSKTWANDERDASGKQIYKFGADYADIIISDNANNTAACDVRVNVDLASPSINLKVKGNGVVHKEINLGGYNESTMKENAFVATIGANDYSAVNPPKNDGKVWFNTTYKNGITIEVDAKDNFYLDRWEWRVNKEGYPTNTANATITSDVKITNKDGASGSFNPVERKKDNVNSKKITVGFKEDGMRYGELWIWDKAKNYTKVMIYANLDKVAPDAPKDVSTHTLKSNIVTASNDKTYTKATWTNKYVRAEVESKYKKDSISGYEKSIYRAFEHNSYTKARETGQGKDANFVFHDGYQGKNKIDFAICDYAENCSSYSPKADIWIDTIDPVCRNELKIDGTLSGAAKGNWLGFKNGQNGAKETATVIGVCSDKDADIGKGSGCRSDEHLEFKYDFEINTTVAGPGGNNKGGTYHDVAGNYTTCPVDQTVKIDYTLPGCTTNKTVSKTEVNGWLNAEGSKGTATVTAHCTDTNSKVTNSGCATADFSKLYNFEIDTKTAGAKGAGANDPGGDVYDNADNFSTCPKNQTVKIDYTKPTCTLVTSLYGSSTYSSYSWLGIGESAIVSPNCTDNPGRDNVKSNCNDSLNNFSYHYNFEINTTKAGAKGDNNGGVVYDIAGNSQACTPNQTVKIDYHAPSCSVTKKVTGTEGPENWLEIGEYATVTASCSDTNGIISGCATKDFSHKYNSDINTTTAGAIGDGQGGSVKDKADNETPCAADKLVKVDHTRPVCDVKKTTSKNENSKGWLNAVGTKGTATVSASCVETKEGVKSGCVTSPFSHLYDYEINSSKAGAVDKNDPGAVYDLAGNRTECAYKTVKIDYTNPKCSVSKSAPGENSALWSGLNEKVTVTATCSDKGGSKCVLESRSKTYAREMKTVSGGAVEVDDGGMFYDNADNYVYCPSDKEFYIDYHAPSIKATLSNTSYSEAGVTALFECIDVSNSGTKTCAGYRGKKGTIYGIRSTSTYKAIDVADNETPCTITIGSKKQKRTASCNYHYACVFTGYSYSGSCSCNYAGATMTTPGCNETVYNAGGCNSYCSAQTSYDSGTGSCSRIANYKRDNSCDCESWNSWSNWSDDSSCTESVGKTSKTDCRWLYKLNKNGCPDELPKPSDSPDKETFVLTYSDPDGKNCNKKTLKQEEGKAWGTLCSPTRSNYTFDGWYDSGGTKYTSTTKATKNVTVYAKWTADASCELEVSSGTKGNNNWYKSNVTVSFKSKVGDSYGMSTSNSATYNSNGSITLSDSTKATTVYGFVKTGSTTNSCSTTIKIDKDYPEFDYYCAKLENQNSFVTSMLGGRLNISSSLSTEKYNSLVSGGATYGIALGFLDGTSGMGSTEQRIGDTSSGMSGSGFTNYNSKANTYFHGAGAPLKVQLRNVCDAAGNCIYTSPQTITCPEAPSNFTITLTSNGNLDKTSATVSKGGSKSFRVTSDYTMTAAMAKKEDVTISCTGSNKTYKIVKDSFKITSTDSKLDFTISNVNSDLNCNVDLLECVDFKITGAQWNIYEDDDFDDDIDVCKGTCMCSIEGYWHPSDESMNGYLITHIQNPYRHPRNGNISYHHYLYKKYSFYSKKHHNSSYMSPGSCSGTIIKYRKSGSDKCL